MAVTIGESLHIVQATRAGTTMNTASTGDWVNLKNAHALWAIIDIARPTAKAIRAEAYSAEDSAGTGVAAITTGIHWYKNDGMAYDRLTAATSSYSSHTDASSTGLFQLVAKLDPTVLATSTPWVAFGVRNSSQTTNFCHITYLLESRYPGYQAFLATTSST